MMKRLPFYIVDVFAEQKYTGNQLAVFRDAAQLSTEQMQRIAKEINYSETTFIVSETPREEGYDVRIFTPARELPFAGHPTLGTAFILQQEIIQHPVERVVLNLKVGQIPVTLSYVDAAIDVLWMQQNSPTLGQQLTVETIAPILNLDISDFDQQLPIEEVSTGLPFMIVPLKNHAALKRAKVNQERLFELIKTIQAQAILVFCSETNDPQNQLSVRVFTDAFGIPEDPATGSANGCLAGYLANHEVFGTTIDVRVEQGYEMGRPSLLLLKAEKRSQSSDINVQVGGKVVMVAKGEFV